MEGMKFEGTVKRSKPRQLPKQYLKSERIRIAEGYSCTATVWVPKTPASKYRPMVVLALTHNGKRLGFNFTNAAEMVIAVEELRTFVGSVCVAANDALNKALREYIAYHEAEMLPSFNDYTLTVVQDKLREKEEAAKAVVVDLSTGEILEGAEHEKQSESVSRRKHRRTASASR